MFNTELKRKNSVSISLATLLVAVIFFLSSKYGYHMLRPEVAGVKTVCLQDFSKLDDRIKQNQVAMSFLAANCKKVTSTLITERLVALETVDTATEITAFSSDKSLFDISGDTLVLRTCAYRSGDCFEVKASGVVSTYTFDPSTDRFYLADSRLE